MTDQLTLPHPSGNARDRRRALRAWKAAHMQHIIAHLRRIDYSWVTLRLAQVELKAERTAERMQQQAKALAVSNRGSDEFLKPHEKMLLAGR